MALFVILLIPLTAGCSRSGEEKEKNFFYSAEYSLNLEFPDDWKLHYGGIAGNNPSVLLDAVPKGRKSTVRFTLIGFDAPEGMVLDEIVDNNIDHLKRSNNSLDIAGRKDTLLGGVEAVRFEYSIKDGEKEKTSIFYTMLKDSKMLVISISGGADEMNDRDNERIFAQIMSSLSFE